MTREVYAPCPQCGEEIPFYQTVDGRLPDERFSAPPSDFDRKKGCPECGTSPDILFDIALGEKQAESDDAVAVADGGEVEDDR